MTPPEFATACATVRVAVQAKNGLVRSEQRSASFIANPHYGKPYAVNLNHAQEELQDLVERITIELELVNVAKELER